MWRNWQTHQTQNLAGNHVGSSPTIGTNEVFIRIYRIGKDKYHSEGALPIRTIIGKVLLRALTV